MALTVSPSILSCDFLNIESEIAPFEQERDMWLHLDVMDGHFVPNLTFGIPIVGQLSQKTALPLDCHLMVSNPLFHIEAMKDMDLHNVTFHYEAVENPLEAVRKARTMCRGVGLAIKPETGFGVLAPALLEEIDLLLVMSVSPGFGGQSFMPSSLENVEKAKKYRDARGLGYVIQIDGGIDDKTARLAVEAGCDNLVAGSYIFSVDRTLYLERVGSLRGGQ